MDSNSIIAPPQYKSLNFVNFSSIPNWSAFAILINRLEYRDEFKLVKIGKLIKRVKDTIKIQDDTIYKRVTIRVQGRGVVQRDEEIGKNIGTKSQFKVSAGQFIMSKIDARNGAFGIVPKELDGAAVTQDFLTYSFNIALLIPEFFVLLTTTKQFYDLCQRASSGTTNRQRIDEQLFLNFEIPLPSLEVQKRLVDAYNKRILEAEKQEKKYQELELEINNYFLEELGIQKRLNFKKQKKQFYTINISDIRRWDIWNVGSDYESQKYKFTRLGDIILGKPQYGANSKAKPLVTDIRYIRITDINEDGTLNDEIVSAEKTEEQYLLKNNDLLIARSGNTVGKTFLYKSSFGKAIFAGYLVRYRLDLTKVYPDYLFYFTKTEIFKNWIQANQRVSAQPNINGQEYLDSPIIIPSIEDQKRILDNILTKKTNIMKLKYLSQINRNEALEDFEKALFKTNN